MTIAHGFAAPSADGPLGPVTFERRPLGPDDVHIDITHCGVCHSDLHMARGEWGPVTYPLVPGHEIIGNVRSVGADVHGLSPGDRVGVGCMVDSCRDCDACDEGDEQYCARVPTWTYGSVEQQTGRPTAGGYSDGIVVDRRYVLCIPGALDPAASAPLLCAGVTMWSPLRRWGAGPGRRVGIVGLGGLGHMGIKLARALGAHVVLFTTSPGKAADARALGADEVVISTDRTVMGAHAARLDLIVDTVAAPHDLDPYLRTLRRDGTLVLVGLPAAPHPSPSVFNLVGARRSIAGSNIGGIRETQEMLDFCGAHGIVSEIERIPIQAVNEAYERMLAQDVKYRFVIDMASLAQG